jgi:hypothetical protein
VRISPGLGLLRLLIDRPLRERESFADVRKDDAHAATDPATLDHLGGRELALAGHKVSEQAQGLALGRLSALRVELDEQDQIGTRSRNAGISGWWTSL